ncbi:MAG: DUF58 domain-containing protein [Chloroflexota bacterium]
MSSRLIFIIVAIVASWVLAFNTGRDLAFNMAYLLTGLLAFSYLWAYNSIRGIEVRRQTRNYRSQVGQYAEEQFEVTNHSLLPKLWLEVADYSMLTWHDVSRVVSSLGRRNTTRNRYRWLVKTLCMQRGRFELGPMSIHSGDPLGIFAVEQQIPEKNHIVVYPLTVDLVSFEPSISDLSGGEARHRRTLNATTNVSGVRDYVPGDSLNRIHWPTTARARRLMTKEFELDPTADIWLYLDLFHEAETAIPWTPPPPEIGPFALRSRNRMRANMQGIHGQIELPPNTTEYAVTVAASLARYFLMRNRAVGFNCYGNSRELLQADRGERQLTKILETLSVVQAGGHIPFSHLLTTDSMRLNRNDTVVAISPDPTLEWARALQQMQRRGVNSVAVIIDRNSFGDIFDYEPLLSQLFASGISAYRVHCDQAIDQALNHPVVSV